MVSLASGHEKFTLGLLTLLPVTFFYGLRFPVLGFFIPVILFVLCGHLFFFRDPNRPIVEEPNALLAPADGKIFEIDSVTGIIRIRMSLFNVHVTRIPISGIIKEITYFKGKHWPFFSFLYRGTIENSRQTIQIENSLGIFKIVQIVGILARRCDCNYKRGDQIQQGKRLGIIYYGSEVDVHFPGDKFEILVQKGEKTIAGITSLAILKKRKKEL
ncbi:MAG: phosphatidylserine decarboxylase [Candidatus Hodarchaeales archaeon]|jgi:phosphatidylserine decarboxylase